MGQVFDTDIRYAVHRHARLCKGTCRRQGNDRSGEHLDFHTEFLFRGLTSQGEHATMRIIFGSPSTRNS
jgi:hypothetical protein